MRIPRYIVRRIAKIIVDTFSIDVLDTATESLTTEMHNVEIEADIREYNAVDIT